MPGAHHRDQRQLRPLHRPHGRGLHGGRRGLSGPGAGRYPSGPAVPLPGGVFQGGPPGRAAPPPGDAGGHGDAAHLCGGVRRRRPGPGPGAAAPRSAGAGPGRRGPGGVPWPGVRPGVLLLHRGAHPLPGSPPGQRHPRHRPHAAGGGRRGGGPGGDAGRGPCPWDPGGDQPPESHRPPQLAQARAGDAPPHRGGPRGRCQRGLRRLPLRRRVHPAHPPPASGVPGRGHGGAAAGAGGPRGAGPDAPPHGDGQRL